MNRIASRWIALGGIAGMIAILLFPAPSVWTMVITVPLIVLFITGLRPPSRWGGWVAVTMVPYLSVALGEAIADADTRMAQSALVACALIVFFAAMHFVRKIGASLRR